MDRGCVRAVARERRSACSALCVAALLAFAVGGCSATGPSASLQGARDTTIAFESIDGPPPAVFRKLVQKLNEEAEARQVPVTTREGFAPYRVRAYVAVGVEKKKKRATVSWVWDVYEANERRALRIGGEESVDAAGSDAWASANDAVLSRIARSGMDRLAAFLNSPEAPSDQPAADPAVPEPATRDKVALAPAMH